jgi:hypothetical protein
MRIQFFILITLLVFSACKRTVTETNATQLRIQNHTSLVYDSVHVISPGGKQVYYQINPGGFSGYKPFSFLYRYAYIEVFYNGRKLILQPFDYVGEQKLNPGKYTYQLGIMFTLQEFLTIECKQD